MSILTARLIYSDHDLFEIVEYYRGQEAAERFGDCLSDLPEYPVDGLIDRLNQELDRLGLGLRVEDLVRKESDQYVWMCMVVG
jgi:hypothetical protein